MIRGFAGIRVMRALNGHVERVFNPIGKTSTGGSGSQSGTNKLSLPIFGSAHPAL
jgi:hypothetical protein